MLQAGVRGRFVKTRPLGKNEPPTDIDISASILWAARSGRPEQTEKYLQKKLRVPQTGRSILFCLDASDSMGVQQRIAAAKGAVLALLSRSYVQRDKVGLIAFSGKTARTVLSPTKSVTLAAKKIADMAIGEATPFSAGITLAMETAVLEKKQDYLTMPILVIISDGEANVPLNKEAAADKEALQLMQSIKRSGFPSLFIDTKSTNRGTNEMLLLSQEAGGRYLHLSKLEPAGIVAAVSAM
ncbi:MAG: VWA domain-containing protein [Spirochaetia bacterium]